MFTLDRHRVSKTTSLSPEITSSGASTQWSPIARIPMPLTRKHGSGSGLHDMVLGCQHLGNYSRKQTR